MNIISYKSAASNITCRAEAVFSERKKMYVISGEGEKTLGGVIHVGATNRNNEARAAVKYLDVGSCTTGVKPTYYHRLELIVVVVDISAVSVRTRVTGASGGVFIIVVLTALVSGASVVHPVRQVSLQPLVRGGTHKIGRAHV